MQGFCLIPQPQSVKFQGESSLLCSALCAALPQELAMLNEPLKTLWPKLVLQKIGGDIIFCHNSSIEKEGYKLQIKETQIFVNYSNSAGALYALMTLRQLALQAQGALPLCEAEDAPALEIRGYMLDISRGKIPSLSTLKRVADDMARLKYNHFELYFEGFSFAYPSFPEVWQKLTPLTSGEIKELDIYCKHRCIDLVPHQNSLGHMAPWLGLSQFAALAEGGLEFGDKILPPTTLDACDSKSVRLVETLVDDLMPNFTSQNFHVGMDEPFELGKGKNKQRAQNEGIDNMYLEYTLEMHKIIKQRGKTMMMWGDIIGKSNTLAERLPKDIIVVDWGYEAEHPAEKRAKNLQAAGLDFCMCAGTSLWSSFTGMTDNMLENIAKSGRAAHSFGAKGLILSDWGDMGHFQYHSLSYTGLTALASWAWNKQGASETEIAAALDKLVFEDSANILGALSMKAGRYYLLEEFMMPCRTMAMLPLMVGVSPPEIYENQLQMLVRIMRFFSDDSLCEIYEKSFYERKTFNKKPLLALLNEASEMADKARPQCEDAALILREYKNALLAVTLLCRARAVILGDNSEREGLAQELRRMMCEHRALWQERNKIYGMEKSIEAFERIAQNLSAKTIESE